MAKGLLHISPSSVAPHKRAPLLESGRVYTFFKIRLVFSVENEYSYFSGDFRLKTLL